MLKIITVPNQSLNQPTQPIKKIDQKIKQLINQMEKTLDAQKDPEGVGLAAPQVGVPLSLFIIKINKKMPIKVFINSKILIKKNPIPSKKKKEKRNKLEGCLSIPRIWGVVDRAKKILVEYQNEEGVLKKEWFSDFKAIVIQHEIDHLQGILFTKRAIEQGKILYQEKDKKLVPIKI